METRIVDWNEKEAVAKALQAGEVVLFPTETVYGIACLASSEAAYEKLRDAKGRPEAKPFTLMCADIGSVVERCQINIGTAEVMQKFMPGEITLLLKGRPGIPHCMDLGTGVVGVRIPNAKDVLELIEMVGEPLLVSSANMSGSKPAQNAKEAIDIFDSRVAYIVKGECVSHTPSTIVDLTGDAPKLIRQGNIEFENIEGVYQKVAKPIALGSDHGGYLYKEEIKKHLIDMGYDVLDFGCHSTSSVDYPQFGKAVAEAVVQGKAELGVVVCTSGEGISMAANKVPGARCGIGYDDAVTAKTREHNNANVIAFGQKYMKLEDVLRRVDIFLSVPFSVEAKHHRRVDQLDK